MQGATGHQHDAESGLIYMNARFYDPVLGSFLTQDTYLGEFGDPMSLHRSMYVNGNPTGATDPTGTQICRVNGRVFAVAFGRLRRATCEEIDARRQARQQERRENGTGVWTNSYGSSSFDRVAESGMHLDSNGQTQEFRRCLVVGICEGEGADDVLTDLTTGVGRGLAEMVAGPMDMVANPRETARAFIEMAKEEGAYGAAMQFYPPYNAMVAAFEVSQAETADEYGEALTNLVFALGDMRSFMTSLSRKIGRMTPSSVDGSDQISQMASGHGTGSGSGANGSVPNAVDAPRGGGGFQGPFVNNGRPLSQFLRNKIKRIQNEIAAGGPRGVAGTVSEVDARVLGELWVGPNYRTAAGGYVLISADGLRQFRNPANKTGVNRVTGEPWSTTGRQVNFQAREVAEGSWTGNVHVDVE